MQEIPLYQNIITVIQAGLAANSLPAYPVLQDFQPTQQGMDSAPTIYIHKMPDHRYGLVKRTDVWDSIGQQMVHTETQFYETTFQITCYSTQNPSDLSSPTANDIANSVVAILQSSATLAALAVQGLRILRITDIRHPYFSDDRVQNEAAPSFDFTITHEQDIISTVPIISEFDYGFYRI